MAAPINKGTALLIGIGLYTYTGYLVQDVTIKVTGEERKVKGEDGATAAVILTDLGTSIELNLVALSATTPTTLAKGDSITINSVVYRITDVDVKRVRGEECNVRISAEKEASMTYT